MTNISSKIKRKRPLLINVLCRGALVICISYAGYVFALWVSMDFAPHFMQIDQCLDHGGKWDDAALICIDK